MIFRKRGDFFRRAGGDDFAAALAAFGAEIDDPIGGFHHVEIVLDDDHRVAQIDQAARARRAVF